MSKNQKIILEMLDQIDSARSGGIAFEALEEKLWRLLDATDSSFPPIVAGQVEDFVLQLRRLQQENLRFAAAHEADDLRGAEALFHELTNTLTRELG